MSEFKLGESVYVVLSGKLEFCPIVKIREGLCYKAGGQPVETYTLRVDQWGGHTFRCREERIAKKPTLLFAKMLREYNRRNQN